MAKVTRITKDNQNPVGMIVPSMLTEAQFQAINGTNWILADGRSILGSQYEVITGNANAPDLRGMFLRGKNNGRADGNQDLGGERALANFQGEATKRPTIPLTTDNPGSHSHSQFDNVGGTGGSNLAAAAAAFTAGRSATTSSDGSHTHTITGGGDAETRPKNIAVNYFIKIN